MSRRSRRILTKLARNSGWLLETDRDEFGQMLQFYDGIPIGVSDYIADNQTQGTSNDCSTLYAFQMGEGALSGLTAETAGGISGRVPAQNRRGGLQYWGARERRAA